MLNAIQTQAPAASPLDGLSDVCDALVSMLPATMTARFDFDADAFMLTVAVPMARPPRDFIAACHELAGEIGARIRFQQALA